MHTSRTGIVAALLLAGIALQPAAAKPFKWANDLDAATLDPYARNVVFDLMFAENTYEGLTRRGPDLKLQPALATEWKLVSPTTWRYTLRRNVRFQDGTPFTADDVIFSYQRASTGPGTAIAGYFAPVKEMIKVDDFTVDVVTRAPDPILPEELSGWLIMSKAWAERNNLTRIAEVAKNEENFAVLHSNGTGPFVVKSRRPDVATEWEPYAGWWDKPEHNLTQVTFNLLKDPNARVAALRAGSVDMIYSVPTQNVADLSKRKGLRVVQSPETRTIFLALDQGSAELAGSSVKGKNPFRDLRVRKALQLALDLQAIKTKIMRGFSLPNALLVGPGINGYDAALNKPVGPDAAAAKKLLAEAGYPDGFEVAMECPNNRYVNDEQICQAVVGMLAQIGVKVKLTAMPMSLYAAKISPPGYGAASIAFVGWSPTTYDAHNTIFSLFMSRKAEIRQGLFNFHNNSFPDIDRLGAAIGGETDIAKRNGLIREALVNIRDNVLALPMHQQVVLWAAKDSVKLKQRADNFFPLRHVRVD